MESVGIDVGSAAERVRFIVQYPMDPTERGVQLATPSALAEFVRTAEEVGFDAIAFTDHPAPSTSWLWGPYGHATLDPFAALSFCAAHTESIRLLSYLAVAAYRHPLLLTKSAITADVLSQGRLILGVAAGYLEPEFLALGIEHADRGQLLEAFLSEAAELFGAGPISDIGGIPTGVEIELAPAAHQMPRPPIWVGGNSGTSRRRAAQFADGWAPLIIDRARADAWGTNVLDSSNLAVAVSDLHRLALEWGRDSNLDVVIKSPESRIRPEDFDVSRHAHTLSNLVESGMTWYVVHPMADDSRKALKLLERYGKVIEFLSG